VNNNSGLSNNPRNSQHNLHTYSLQDGWSGVRNPVGAKFSLPVLIGPGIHPASVTKGNGTFPRVNRAEFGFDYPPLSSAKVEERAQLYVYPPSDIYGLL
jgi:hypothetical protein